MLEYLACFHLVFNSRSQLKVVTSLTCTCSYLKTRYVFLTSVRQALLSLLSNILTGFAGSACSRPACSVLLSLIYCIYSVTVILCQAPSSIIIRLHNPFPRHLHTLLLYICRSSQTVSRVLVCLLLLYAAFETRSFSCEKPQFGLCLCRVHDLIDLCSPAQGTVPSTTY